MHHLLAASGKNAPAAIESFRNTYPLHRWRVPVPSQADDDEDSNSRGAELADFFHRSEDPEAAERKSTGGGREVIQIRAPSSGYLHVHGVLVLRHLTEYVVRTVFH